MMKSVHYIILKLLYLATADWWITLLFCQYYTIINWIRTSTANIFRIKFKHVIRRIQYITYLRVIRPVCGIRRKLLGWTRKSTRKWKCLQIQFLQLLGKVFNRIGIINDNRKLIHFLWQNQPTRFTSGHYLPS